jgi:uncharacterized protein (TIRG00374 family)
MLPDVDWRKTGVGFLASVVLLTILVSLAGLEAVANAIAVADTRVLPTLVLAAAVWVTAWGLALHSVLRTLGVSIPRRTAIVLYAAAAFANNVTPFGQAGGEPFSALMLSRAADTKYETGLASIASVDAINFFPSILMATSGLAYFALEITFGRRLLWATAGVATIAVLVLVGGVALWYFRRRIERLLARVLEPVVVLAARFVPGRSAPPREQIHERIVSFFQAIDRVAADRDSLVVTLSFSTLGWLALVASLYLSLSAVTATYVPLAAVFLVIPVGSLASATPLPGGFAGIETVMVLLLIPTAGVSASTATAAVLIHRTATYVLPTAVGGGVALSVGRN